MKKAYRLWFSTVADAKKLTKCLRERGAAVVGRTNIRNRDTDAAPEKVIAAAKSCKVSLVAYEPFETYGRPLPDRDGDYRPEDGKVVKRWIKEENVSFVAKKKRRIRFKW